MNTVLLFLYVFLIVFRVFLSGGWGVCGGGVGVWVARGFRWVSIYVSLNKISSTIRRKHLWFGDGIKSCLHPVEGWHFGKHKLLIDNVFCDKGFFLGCDSYYSTL